MVSYARLIVITSTERFVHVWERRRGMRAQVPGARRISPAALLAVAALLLAAAGGPSLADGKAGPADAAVDRGVAALEQGQLQQAAHAFKEAIRLEQKA